ncbi:MAG: FAD-binding oxidoreductase [Candidatus Nanopelagicales bacterium]
MVSTDTVQRWGAGGHGIPESLHVFLDERGMGTATPRPAVDLASVDIRAPRIPADELAALPCGVDTDDLVRLRCSGGFSFIDLCKRRWPVGQVPVVDAVVLPENHDQVRAVLDAAAAKGWAVVPFGGGTTVVDGVDVTDRLTIGVAFWRMNQVHHLDPESGEVLVGPGITGPELERWLEARGFTWGHIPQSWERATVGGYAVTRSAGQTSTGYGRADATVTKLRVAAPKADFALGKAPGTAAGPDLQEVFLGSEGAFGIVTEVGLRVRPLPEKRHYTGVLFPTFTAGTRAFRELAQQRAVADIMRLSDADESAVNLAMSSLAGLKKEAFDRYSALRGVAGGCLAIVGWEGPADVVSARRKHAHTVFRRFGGVGLGTTVGRSWEKNRFSAPYLRDDLLDAGYLVETLETANEWSQLQATYDAVHAGLRGVLGEPLIGTHLSHIYPTGASLYFTVICPLAEDPIGQWHEAKRAATDALVATDATITHHHSVGRDHAPWLPAEIGESGMDLLRAIKAHLDPDGIMNPGVLGLG